MFFCPTVTYIRLFVSIITRQSLLRLTNNNNNKKKKHFKEPACLFVLLLTTTGRCYRIIDDKKHFLYSISVFKISCPEINKFRSDIFF